MKFIRGSQAQCWEWLAAKSDKGYGKLMVDTQSKKFELAHRYAYALHFGSIPPGMVVRHKCDNQGCVNPYHLELGTQKDNIRDAVQRGRLKQRLSAIGEKNGSCKFTDEQVEQMRVMQKEGASFQEIAHAFNASYSHVTKVCRKGARVLDLKGQSSFLQTTKSQGVGDARKKVTEEMKEQILALIKEGKTHRETADIVGLSQAHVTTILKKLNGGKLQKPRIPEETVQKVKELRLSGMSFARIGESLNLSKATVQTIVKRVMAS